MFVTTAISYTNGDPHIGHAFEYILADVIARWNRSRLPPTRKGLFLTGTDEHGRKIETTAALKGMSPKELCDLYSGKFRELCTTLQISQDKFIRTTGQEHKDCVLEFFKKCRDDIYLGVYQGWYNPKEESFITEFDARKTN